jgi:hypothetical protein
VSATPWTPIDVLGGFVQSELLRPWVSPPGCLLDVSAFEGRVGQRDEAMAALFGVMSTFPDVGFRVTVGRWDLFHEWVRWAQHQVNGRHSAPLGQLFLHHLQRVSEADVFRTDTDATSRRSWPLRNVTLATRPLRTQAEVDSVVPKLLTAPAATRMLVLSPQEPIDLAKGGNGYLYAWCSTCEWRSGAEAAPLVVDLGHCCPFCGENAILFPRLDAVQVRGVGPFVSTSALRRLRAQVVAELGPDGFSIDGFGGTQGTLDGVEWSEDR